MPAWGQIPCRYKAAGTSHPGHTRQSLAMVAQFFLRQQGGVATGTPADAYMQPCMLRRDADNEQKTRDCFVKTSGKERNPRKGPRHILRHVQEPPTSDANSPLPHTVSQGTQTLVCVLTTEPAGHSATQSPPRRYDFGAVQVLHVWVVSSGLVSDGH